MGVLKTPDYAAGSMTIAKTMAESDAMTIVGGGTPHLPLKWRE